MNAKEVLLELKNYGDEGIRNIYLRHGGKEPVYGVRVQDMKKIVKKVKKNHTLSLELFDTGISDAMYLAGLIADENVISKNELKSWAKKANNYGISEYTVAWVAAESKFGLELGLEWIESDKENIASSGWSTLANLASIKPDHELDIEIFSELLERVKKNIHHSDNRVRYTMNGFVIAIGCYMIELTEKATDVAENIGKVQVNMGKTACKVPLASDYIKKVINKGKLGKKRKQARC